MSHRTSTVLKAETMDGLTLYCECVFKVHDGDFYLDEALSLSDIDSQGDDMPAISQGEDILTLLGQGQRSMLEYAAENHAYGRSPLAALWGR